MEILVENSSFPRTVASAATLAPPFSRENAIRKTELCGPLIKHTIVLNPNRDLSAHLGADLSTVRIDCVYQSLWLAGLSRPARPLHRQRLLQRAIDVTEDPNEHLVWYDHRILIKPLPEYLLDYDFWADELCRDNGLHASACGLLLSYSWLIVSPSDLRVAIEAGLLPQATTWNLWASLISDFLGRLDTRKLYQVDRRYHYGELRLSRLDSLYRLGFAGLSMRNMVLAFMPLPDRYNTFFKRNFSWIIVGFVYVTVILSAMQVALATEQFSRDARLQELSWGVAIMSLALVFAALVLMAGVWAFLFCYHLYFARSSCRQAERVRNRPSF